MNRFKIQHLLIILFPLLGAWLGSFLSGAEKNNTGISLLHLALATALLCGSQALFQRHLKSNWQLYTSIAIALAFLYSMLSLILVDAPISVFSLLLPNLLYCLTTMFLIRYIYYGKILFRIRTLLMGVAGGLMLSLYLAGLYTIMNIGLIEGFWNASFMYGLIIYVFIVFSMSVADLIILQIDVKKLRQEVSNDDDH